VVSEEDFQMIFWGVKISLNLHIFVSMDIAWMSKVTCTGMTFENPISNKHCTSP
jgi:hypothetical protein